MASLMQSDRTLLDRGWASLSVTRTVDASSVDVWTLIADHQQWLTWYRPLKDLRLETGSRLEVGTVLYEHEGPWKTTSEVMEWDEGRMVGLAMRTLNLRGLLSGYYRRIEVHPADAHTEVTIIGGFTFGTLGWVLFPYTYPQMHAAMYFEYRSALKGLAAAAEGTS